MKKNLKNYLIISLVTYAISLTSSAGKDFVWPLTPQNGNQEKKSKPEKRKSLSLEEKSKISDDFESDTVFTDTVDIANFGIITFSIDKNDKKTWKLTHNDQTYFGHFNTDTSNFCNAMSQNITKHYNSYFKHLSSKNQSSIDIINHTMAELIRKNSFKNQNQEQVKFIKKDNGEKVKNMNPIEKLLYAAELEQKKEDNEKTLQDLEPKIAAALETRVLDIPNFGTLEITYMHKSTTSNQTLIPSWKIIIDGREYKGDLRTITNPFNNILQRINHKRRQSSLETLQPKLVIKHSLLVNTFINKIVTNASYTKKSLPTVTIEKKDFPQISSVFTIIREQSSSTMDVTQLLDPSNSLLTYDPSTSEHPIINGIVLEPFYETPSTRNPDGSITPGHKTYKL